MGYDLLIRADGNVQMGTGHVMRCISLAQGWRRAGGKVLFALAEATPNLEQRLRGEDFSFVRLNAPMGGETDVAQTVALARRHSAAWVIADGYHFGADYQCGIKTAGLRLLLFDDYGHATHYSADVILNQDLCADARLYQQREKHARLLLGPRYVLLREQFQAWRNWKRSIPKAARNILLTLGGSDPNNVTGKVIEALCGLDVKTKIVVGGSNPHLGKLQAAIRGSKPAFELVVDATNMPELMAWADTAIAAGGTTSSELLFMGLPMLLLVLADNQRLQVEAVHREGAGLNMGPPDHLTTDVLRRAVEALQSAADRRKQMSARGRQLVDGAGIERVIQAIRTAGKQDATPATDPHAFPNDN